MWPFIHTLDPGPMNINGGSIESFSKRALKTTYSAVHRSCFKCKFPITHATSLNWNLWGGGLRLCILTSFPMILICSTVSGTGVEWRVAGPVGGKLQGDGRELARSEEDAGKDLCVLPNCLISSVLQSGLSPALGVGCRDIF